MLQTIWGSGYRLAKGVFEKDFLVKVKKGKLDSHRIDLGKMFLEKVKLNDFIVRWLMVLASLFLLRGKC